MSWWNFWKPRPSGVESQVPHVIIVVGYLALTLTLMASGLFTLTTAQVVLAPFSFTIAVWAVAAKRRKPGAGYLWGFALVMLAGYALAGFCAVGLCCPPDEILLLLMLVLGFATYPFFDLSEDRM